MSKFNIKNNFSTNCDNNATTGINLNEVELYDLLGTDQLKRDGTR
jgi:hypothetical protein